MRGSHAMQAVVLCEAHVLVVPAEQRAAANIQVHLGRMG